MKENENKLTTAILLYVCSHNIDDFQITAHFKKGSLISITFNHAKSDFYFSYKNMNENQKKGILNWFINNCKNLKYNKDSFKSFVAGISEMPEFYLEGKNIEITKIK
jgi:hypothetical protein